MAIIYLLLAVPALFVLVSPSRIAVAISAALIFALTLNGVIDATQRDGNEYLAANIRDGALFAGAYVLVLVLLYFVRRARWAQLRLPHLALPRARRADLLLLAYLSSGVVVGAVAGCVVVVRDVARMWYWLANYDWWWWSLSGATIAFLLWVIQRLSAPPPAPE